MVAVVVAGALRAANYESACGARKRSQRAGKTLPWVASGVLAFSLCASGAQADVIPPKIDTTTPTGVSIPDTYFRVDTTDLSIGNMQLQRFSQSPSKYWADYSPFGMLMTSNFDIYVQATFVKATGSPFFTPAHYHTTVHLGNSSVGVFSSPNTTGTGIISSHSGDANAGLLTWAGTAYQFTDNTGAVYTFNPSVTARPSGVGTAYESPVGYSQRVDHITYPDGRVRQFYYDASKRLKLVTDTTGYAILFDFGANGFVSAACAVDLARSTVTTASSCAGQPLTVGYQYGTVSTTGSPTSAVLTGFTDVRGQTTTYTRTGGLSTTVSCVTPPGASSCQTQLSFGTGLQQTMAGGSVWTFYSDQNVFATNDPESPADTSYQASVVDPAGKTTTYNFAGSSPLRVIDANGKTTTYKWCCSQLGDVNSPATFDGTMLTEVDFPEGNKYLAGYGGPYNAITQRRMVAKPGSGLADQVVNYGYDYSGASGTFYSQPTSIVDANGKTTNWTFSSFGAVLTEMQPPPNSGAARPLKVNTYVQKYAYILSGGSLVPSGGPIWMISTETQCQTAAGSSTPTCDGTAPQRVKTYEYGANGTVDNLLVRGVAVTADGQTLRTCYGYDAQSRKISTTTPRASLSVCP